jgi:hypothetical protein
MGKYKSVYDDVYSIFSSSAWLLESIKTYPQNYLNSGNSGEYIRVAVVTSSYYPGKILLSSSGQIVIDIFVTSGEGLSRITTIADKLDTYLVGKTLKGSANGNTQLGTSSLVMIGEDSANPSLYRASYSISFNYFGT